MPIVGALARWCFQRRKVVLAVWLVAMVGLFAVNRAAKPAFSTEFQLPNTASAAALNLLAKDFPSASGSSDQIVLHATSGTLLVPAVQARAESMLAAVAKLPHVRSVSSPYAATGKTQISKDDTVAFATVDF